MVSEVGDDEPFDCMIPFSNLPFVFSTTLATVPGGTPYLAAEPERVAAWRGRLGTHGWKVGLCWRGSQDWRADPHRSIPLDLFAPLFDLPRVRLISLQVGDGGAATRGVALERLDGIDDGPDGFVDTAAIMANLDLIVTIDTSIAHLAGALARPVHVLLRKVPEWRWLLGREDTPWYPTMRLFRQDEPDDWSAPMRRLADAVRTSMAETNSPHPKSAGSRVVAPACPS